MNVFNIIQKIYECCYDTNIKRVFSQHIVNYKSQKTHMIWMHLGKVNITFGEFINIIQRSNIMPLRTGHVGDWSDMITNYSNSTDHNGIVCNMKWGKPLIYELTQTENDADTTGDTSYAPASFIEKGQRKKLKLWLYNGASFQEACSHTSHLTPFVYSPYNDNYMPLSHIHRQREKYPEYKDFLASLFIVNKELFISLTCLLLKSVTDPQYEINLGNIIDKVTTRQGILSRVKPSYKEESYIIASLCYKNIESLAQHIAIPFLCAHDETYLMKNFHDIPKTIPLLSLEALHALTYFILYYNEKKSFITHIDWGAFGSAGYPPVKNGYYQSKAKDIIKIYNILCYTYKNHIDASYNIQSIFLLLAPSVILNLLPNKSYKKDIKAIEALFLDLKNNKKDFIQASDKKFFIQKLTHNWYMTHKNELSLYFQHKFHKKRRLYESYNLKYSEVVVPPSFYHLTLQQLSMVSGEIKEIFERNE